MQVENLKKPAIFMCMAGRTGIRANLVREVYRWFREQEFGTGLSKTMLVTAGITALRLFDESERAGIIQWAKAVDEGIATWSELGNLRGKSARERSKILIDRWKEVLARELEAESKDSPTSGLKVKIDKN